MTVSVLKRKDCRNGFRIENPNVLGLKEIWKFPNALLVLLVFCFVPPGSSWNHSGLARTSPRQETRIKRINTL
ncbi:hypothetical protein DLM78_17340 [Leptospira stimsonii]|uniref:Uncharacterized protein n=1 Tax=Leptospira stimsonii TaxID=2202203 RepID=A0A8B3CMB4_9LEPT|nr:hypothetical protein DLM78_17340 [Leptospira stimsonii]